MNRQVPPVPTKRAFTKDGFISVDSDGYACTSAPQPEGSHIYEDLKRTLAGITPFQEASFQLILGDSLADSKCDTAVCRLVTSSKLPFIIKVKRNFIGLGDGVVGLQKDDILLFHFIGRLRRVLTIDDNGRKFLLPIQAKQLYDILPSVQKYDDKVFKGTEAVIKAKPLPNRLRILEAHYSIFAEESQDIGDVIEISHVERRRSLPHKTGVIINRVLVGKYNNNNTFAFPESMTCSTYTAMISDKPCPLSEILEKYPFPIRVRTPEDKRVYLLSEYRDDILVIATHCNSNQVIAIPVKCQIDVEKETNLSTDRLLQELLPALYPLLNCSHGIAEVGRSALPENLRQIPQPIKTILDQWKDSYEGQKFLQLNSKGKNRYLRYGEMETNANAHKKKAVSGQFSRSVPQVPPKLPPKPSPREIRSMNDDTNEDKALPNIPPREDLKELLDKKNEEIQSLLQENKELREKHENVQKLLAHLENDCSQQTALQDGECSKEMKIQEKDHENEKTEWTAVERPVIDEILSKQVKLSSASVEEVGFLLTGLGLDFYVTSFREELVNGELLIRLDEDILNEEMGMKKIQARRLMLEVSKRLRNEEDNDKFFEAADHQEEKQNEFRGPVEIPSHKTEE